MGDSKAEFDKIRASLEAADGALAEALDARAEAIQALIELRHRDPEGYYALPRDAETVRRTRDLVKAFPERAVEPVMREVLSASASLVAPVRVAYVEPEGGFANAAARLHFGAEAELILCETALHVLDEVERQRASYGVVPLETSSDGATTATLHGLVRADVRICGELALPASYHLLSVAGAEGTVDKIYGAPAGIAACERYVRTYHPQATVIDVPSAVVAAQFVRDDQTAAAVGNDLVRQISGLSVVRERIEDVAGVETRFAVVGTEHPSRTGHDRTVLALAVLDEPGALYHALKAFADRSVNLTRLESRPTRGEAWRYVFFLELEGHVTDRSVLTALEELRGTTRFVKVLGSYPKPV